MFDSEDVRDWWNRINWAWKYNAKQVYGIHTQDLIIFFGVAGGVLLVFLMCCACCEICDACLDPEPSTGYFLNLDFKFLNRIPYLDYAIFQPKFHQNSW